MAPATYHHWRVADQSTLRDGPLEGRHPTGYMNALALALGSL